MYKFSKFSKFISACFSLGILFSGLQTYGMNLTKPSVLDGIKAEFSEKCDVCSQKAFRVLYMPGKVVGACRDNNCFKKICDKFNIKLNTENIHRCDWFKDNMQNYQIAKYRNYEDPASNMWWGVGKDKQEELTLKLNALKIFDEDKLIDEVFLLCGHSICRCQNCISQYENVNKLVCPTCKTIIRGCIVVSSIAETDMPMFQTRLKITKLLSEKLENEWKNTIVLSNTPYDNIDKIADYMFSFFIDGNIMDNFTFCENRLNKIDGELALGEKILVYDMTTTIKDSLKFLPWNKFDDYIKSLKECGKDKMIVYPTNGELYDKIQAAMNK